VAVFVVEGLEVVDIGHDAMQLLAAGQRFLEQRFGLREE
jgi:hypothetical protein